MKILNKIIAIVIVSILIVTLVPFSSGVNAEEVVAGTPANEIVVVYASKVKKETSEFYKYDSKSDSLELNADYDMDFVIDQDISFNSICSFTKTSVDSSSDSKYLYIKGNHKLTVLNGFSSYSHYTQDTGVNVVVQGTGLNVESVRISSGSSLTLDCKNVNENDGAIEAYDFIYSLGTINVNSNSKGISSWGPHRFDGGEVHIDAKSTALFSAMNIEVQDARVYASSTNGPVLHAGYAINIINGYVESTLKTSGSTSNMEAWKGINISAPMYLKTPVEGNIKYYKDASTGDVEYMVYDKDGNIPSKVVISSPEEDARVAAEEEAAKKAAEEAAAKKAAEEEAAKKAAEEAAAKKAAEEAAKNNSGKSSGQGNASSSTSTGDSSAKQYKNEWVDGRWYNSEGVSDYDGTLEWKCNSTGWWVEDSEGWYPVSQWQKIDGKWYYFTESGYMDYSEYRDGYWLGSDGALVDGYYGEWKSDSTGWWFEDQSGWYPTSQWVWINGNCYYFKSNGYMATNEYIDGCWVGIDGAWVK